MQWLHRLAANRLGALAVLAMAAWLEAWGDSFFQSGFYRASGWARAAALGCGVLLLAAYGALLNLPRWEFGRLLGVYIVLFFVTAQLLAKLRFAQPPTAPIYAGGSLIIAGGLVIAFWKG